MALKTVYVELLAETKGLTKGLKKAEKRVGMLTSAAKKLGGALAGAFAGRAIFRGFQQTLKQTDELIKTAKGVGFTVDEYERLTFALSQVGVSAESARIGLGDLQKRLGNQNFWKHYKAVGLDPKQLLKMTPAQQLETALNALTQFSGNQALLVSRAGGVFEEQSGKDFAKVITQWKEFTRARKDYDRLIGGNLGSAAVQDIEELSRQTRLLSAQWLAVKRQMVVDVAPAVIDAIESIADSGALQFLANDVKDFITQVNGLIQDIGDIGRAWNMILEDSPAPPGSGKIKKFLSAQPFNAPSGKASPRDSVVIYQNNKFTVVDRESVRGIGKAVKKANEESLRAP